MWYVGLSYTTEMNKKFHDVEPSVWMKNTETKVTIPRKENSGWVIFNLQSSGVILNVIHYALNFKKKLYCQNPK